jgi:hypothetical protein
MESSIYKLVLHLPSQRALAHMAKTTLASLIFKIVSFSLKVGTAVQYDPRMKIPACGLGSMLPYFDLDTKNFDRWKQGILKGEVSLYR